MQEFLQTIKSGFEKEKAEAFSYFETRKLVIDTYLNTLDEFANKIQEVGSKYRNDIENALITLASTQNELSKVKEELATARKLTENEVGERDKKINVRETLIKDLTDKEDRLQKRTEALLAEQRGIEENLVGLRVQGLSYERETARKRVESDKMDAVLQDKKNILGALIEEIAREQKNFTKIKGDIIALRSKQ